MRKVLQEGTWIRLSQGELYKITGKPIGEGGGSIVYPCKKISYLDGKITVSEIDYALKECFPLSAAFVFERREDGEIVSASEDPASVRYLDSVKKMQMQEQEITGKIYNTAARTIPVISASGEVELSFDEGHTFHLVNNTVTIMTSLESKGKALKSYLSQVVYDAFICYRHGETDSQAAKILQQKLEHFYIPWMRKNKIKKIRREQFTV